MMASQPHHDADSGLPVLSTIPAMLWQRRWLIVIPAVLALIAGVAAAFLMHPLYRSSATVLIESQQLQPDLVGTLSGSNATDAIGQRVARARERVLSRMDLIRMIRTYNLYPEEQRSKPLSKIVDKMRDNATIEAQDTSVMGGAKANLGLSNTVAITVAFTYDDPVKAQQVAQELVDHFLETDAGSQASQAADTVNFLTDQANQVQAQLAQIQDKITHIKAENGTVLALGSVSGGGFADVGQIDARIAALRTESARLGANRAGATLDPGVAKAQADLAAAQARYSDSHPDVIAAKAQLDAAKREAAARPVVDASAAQLAADRAELSSLQSARALLSSHSSTVATAQARAPLVAGQIDQLEKAADIAREQYRTIADKLQAAQIQSRAESEQKGERLSLADPPIVPDHPVKPNRPLIIAGALVVGLGFGFALAFLLELVLRPLRGSAAVSHALGMPPLAVIPDFDLRQSWIVRFLERRTRRKAAARS